MATENFHSYFRTTFLWLWHFTWPCFFIFLSVSFTFSHMCQSFCLLLGLEKLQKIYINPWYSLFNSPSARQMVENFPSKLFFFKTCLLCEVSALQQKLQLFLRKTNIKKWKHFDCNPKYFSQKKSNPQCVCVCVSIKIFWFGNAATQGFRHSNSHPHSPPWTECPKSAASSVVDHGRGPEALPPLSEGGNPQRRSVSRRSHLQRQWEAEVVEVWLAWDTTGTLLMWNISACGYDISGFEFPLKYWV